MNDLDLSEPAKVHLVAIGGAGMAAIAEVLQGMGHEVRGSDQSDSAAMERLRSLGIEAIVGHDVANVQMPSVAAKSTAVPQSNVEVEELEKQGIRVLHRGELLSAIAVSYTHLTLPTNREV